VIPGRRRCYTRDPAGNRIEIVTYDEPKTIVSYEERSEGSG
jgi:YD repeat-containing protein